MMLEGMAKQGAARANEVLNRAPEEIERYLANKNQEFSTEQECLRELQLIANLGAIASNIMPFSSSWAFEDQNGSFHTRLRLLADGEKLHVNFTCSGSTLSGEMLSWSADTPDSEPQSGDTLNAALGALFLLNQRGAFSESYDQDEIASAAPRARLPLAIGGPFTLLNTSGDLMSDADVVTKPVLLYFGYTSGRDVSFPDMVRNADAAALLRERGYDVRSVFVSVDPERDTPETVAAFINEIDGGILGFTGSKVQVDAAVDAYRAFVSRPASSEEDYVVDHSTFTYLVVPGHGVLEFFRRDMSAPLVAELTVDYLSKADGTPSNGAVPLTAGTLIGFRQEVGNCWVVSPDIKASVTVGFELDREGRVIASTLRLLSSSSEDAVETEAAFAAARRALLRCQGDGYVLPPEKYEEWRDMELLFDSEAVSIK